MIEGIIKEITLPSGKFPYDIELGIRLYKDKIEFDLEPVGSADPIETYSEKVNASEFILIRDWLEEFESEDFSCPGLFGEWSKHTLLKALEALKGWKEEGVA